jgi:acyl carrier protein
LSKRSPLHAELKALFSNAEGSMSNADLREKLRGIVLEIAEIDEVPDATPFKDLGIDSMMAIEIIAEVERTYQIKVAEEDLRKITNLDSVLALVAPLIQ